jgi:tRNA-dihydrouridine synthase
MVTTKAILNGDKNRLLDFDAAEHPLLIKVQRYYFSPESIIYSRTK